MFLSYGSEYKLIFYIGMVYGIVGSCLNPQCLFLSFPMMILALGISISESDLLESWFGKEKATSFLITTLIRIACMLVAFIVSSTDLGFVNLLNLTGSLLGATLTFVFPVGFGLRRSCSSSTTSNGHSVSRRPTRSACTS